MKKFLLTLLICINIVFASLFIFPKEVFAAASISTDASSNLSPTNGESFNVSASISGAQEGEVYFVKCRIGPDTSSLTEGQTFNSITWLNDSGSEGMWVNMPQVLVGSGGVWSGTIQCRVKADVSSGIKLVSTRACLNNNGCGESFASSSSIVINSLPTPSPIVTSTVTATATATAASTATPSPTPAPTKSPTPKPTKKLTPSPEVLGEEVTSTPGVPTGTPAVTSSAKKNFPVLPIIFIAAGVLMIGFAVYNFVSAKKSPVQI